MSDTWRGTYARRYNERMLLTRPQPEPVYRRPTDEQIAAMPEGLAKSITIAARGLHDAGVTWRQAWEPRR